MIAIITVILCWGMRNQKKKKGPIGPTTPKPMGSREKGGNIMGAICSFLCLCKQSANITEKQEYPVDPAQKNQWVLRRLSGT
jgi:hypothetical protein